MNFMTTTAAAEHLADELGGNTATWRTWLTNGRKPGRVIPVQPVTGPGRPQYTRAALDAFVAAERARRLKKTGPAGRAAEVLRAFGIGEDGGSPSGRRFDGTVTGLADDGGGPPFVQLAIASPLLVYRLHTDQAVGLASDLVAAAQVAQLAARGQAEV